MKLYACLLLLLLFPGGALAAETTLSLSLGQALARAAAANPDLALVEYQTKSAELNVEAARGRYQPSLQASSSFSENYQHDPAPGVSDKSDAANLDLTASLNLFNGFADSATLGSATLKLQAAQADLQRQRETLAYDTASRFISSLTAQELVAVAEQDLASQQALEKQIEAFQKSGIRTLADLYQQQAATAQASYKLTDARRNQQSAQLQLLQLLGMEQPVALQLKTPDPTAIEPVLSNLSLEQLLTRAMTERVDLVAQQHRIEAAREQIRVARAGKMPSLDLQASTGSSYSSLQDGSLSEQLDDDLNSSLLLKLSIPIFDRDQTRTAVASASIEELSSVTRLAKLRQQMVSESGQALADYQAALQQRAAAEVQLKATRQAFGVVETRYRVGAATWVELATARSSMVQAEADMIRARYAVLQQGLNIGYQRGDLLALLQQLIKDEESS